MTAGPDGHRPDGHTPDGRTPDGHTPDGHTPDGHERGDIRGRLRRDLQRHTARESQDTFWRSLAVLGTVGWPVALLAVNGVLLGRAIDSAVGTGVQFTLLLLVVGVAVGSIAAWRLIGGFRK